MTDRELTLTEVARASLDVRETVAVMTAEQFRADSVLPDWTRAHVVAHICGFSHAIARQFEFALDGKLIAHYDGGAEGRDADIEALVTEDPVQVRAAMEKGLDRMTAAIGSMNGTDWDLPISYRSGTALDGLLAAWRELVIHLADLDLGHDSGEWSEPFCDHLFEFLATRVPEGTTLVLRSDAGEDVGVGAGPREVVVSGARQDVAAWLAGREPVGPLDFAGGTAPELGPWPARKN